MFPKLSYAEYLIKAGVTDTRQSWIEWKIEYYSMEHDEAMSASYDPDCGYKPLT